MHRTAADYCWLIATILVWFSIGTVLLLWPKAVQRYTENTYERNKKRLLVRLSYWPWPVSAAWFLFHVRLVGLCFLFMAALGLYVMLKEGFR